MDTSPKLTPEITQGRARTCKGTNTSHTAAWIQGTRKRRRMHKLVQQSPQHPAPTSSTAGLAQQPRPAAPDTTAQRGGLAAVSPAPVSAQPVSRRLLQASATEALTRTCFLLPRGGGREQPGTAGVPAGGYQRVLTELIHQAQAQP